MKIIEKILVVIILGISIQAKAQKDFTIKQIQYEIPVLMQKTNNPVLELEFLNNTKEEATIQEVRITLKGTTKLSDIEAIRLFVTNKEGDFSFAKQFGKDLSPVNEIIFNDELKFSGKIYMWVSVQLSKNASLTNKVFVRCSSVMINSKPIETEEYDKLNKLRLGIALRQSEDDGVNTYRIPGLTTTKKGTLLAIYDVRRDSNKDIQGNIDVGLSRSNDGGNTWEPMRIVLDMKEWGGLPQKYNGVGDANILVDETNNNIYVFGLWMHGVLDKDGKFIEGLTEKSTEWEHQWKDKGSQPGYGVKQTSQVIYSISKDDGKTWSEPVNITKMGKQKEWWLWAPAPGHGITLEDGTLVFPSQGRDANGESFSNICYSKDGGKTWQSSNPAYKNTTENMSVQLSDGSIMLNMRHNENRKNESNNNGRAISITKDLGKTWVEHSTSRNALIEPTCMGSLHKNEYTENGEKKSVLLFSNPNSKTKRNNMTIKVSFDEGKTWPKKYWTLLDQLDSRGYSCITSIDEKTIGILFEGSQSQLTFMKLPLADLLKTSRKSASKEKSAMTEVNK